MAYIVHFSRQNQGKHKDKYHQKINMYKMSIV